jgi:hypothetical protein
MRDQLVGVLGGYGDHDKGTDYDIDNTFAWSNYRGNNDWCIYRLSVDTNENMKLSYVPEKKLLIWTYNSTPFAIAPKYQAIGCEVEVVEKLDLGQGYFGYSVPMPNGEDIICEGYTGAIVGSSLEAVIEDTRSGKAATIRQQVADACKERKNAKIISPEEFWDIYLKKP